MIKIYRKLPLLFIAFSLGLTIALIDSSPLWDYTGITAGMVFIAAILLGLVSPKHPWIWALAISLWIPLFGFFNTHFESSAVSVVSGFLGAYLGSVIENGLQRIHLKPVSRGVKNEKAPEISEAFCGPDGTNTNFTQFS